MIAGEGIRQLERGRFLVRVKRVEQRTGRVRNRKATVRGTRAEAIRKRDELRAELASTAQKPARLRLGEYAPLWLERRILKPSTRRKYSFGLRHILPMLGDLYIDSITPADVARYVARRVDEHAGNTVLNELRLLRTIAKDTLAERLAELDWCARVKAPRVAAYDDERPNLLTPHQAIAVLKHVPRQWLGLVLWLMTTGLRIGEATALRWDDIGGGTARIHRGNHRGDEQSVKTKNRTVPALPEILALCGLRRAGELVFATRAGTMHRGSPLRKVLTRACAAAGVKRVTTHGLRRTFNDIGRKHGERSVLQAITGHATDAMTEHYSHIAADEKAALARAVAAAIGVLVVSDERTGKVDK